MIDNYGQLKTAVANWLQRDDLTARIPEFVAGAEDRVHQELRIRPMEVTADLSVSTQEVALPDGFLAVRRLYLDAGSARKKLDFMTPSDFWVRQGSSETGTPQFYTIEGDNIVFGPAPDTTYTGKLLFYKKFDPLTGDTDTNWLFSNARFLLLYGALLESAPFIGDDPRTMTWATLFDADMSALADSDRKDRYPQGSIQSRSLVSGP